MLTAAKSRGVGLDENTTLGSRSHLESYSEALSGISMPVSGLNSKTLVPFLVALATRATHSSHAPMQRQLVASRLDSWRRPSSRDQRCAWREQAANDTGWSLVVSSAGTGARGREDGGGSAERHGLQTVRQEA